MAKRHVPLPATDPYLPQLTEQGGETLTQKEVQERFKKLFDREMTASERNAFFLLQDSDEKKSGD
jgi:hypothetical protein